MKLSINSYQNYLFILYIFNFFIIKSLSYSIELESGEKQCFIVTATKGITVGGSYEVISPNPKPVIVTLNGPGPTNFLHFIKEYHKDKDNDEEYSEGSFMVEADYEGDYTMCIQNGNEDTMDDTRKLIAFNLRAVDSNQVDYEYSGIQSELIALRQGLDFLKDHQSYMNLREDVHKDALDSINTKILCWTVLESVILIAMALWQISYIRSFFETKRRL